MRKMMRKNDKNNMCIVKLAEFEWKFLSVFYRAYHFALFYITGGIVPDSCCIVIECLRLDTWLSFYDQFRFVWCKPYTFVVPTVTRLVQHPLAVKLLDNRSKLLIFMGYNLAHLDHRPDAYTTRPRRPLLVAKAIL